jgi:hypothetical protein
MDAPHRQLESRSLQGLAPRKNVLIYAIDKSAVQIEKKGWPTEPRVAIFLSINLLCLLVWSGW